MNSSNHHRTFVNEVHILGRIGTVRVSALDGITAAHFSIITQSASRSADGTASITTTWHSAAAFDGPGRDVSSLVKGAPVELTGRIEYRRYTGADGIERTVPEIRVNAFTVLPENEPVLLDID